MIFRIIQRRHGEVRLRSKELEHIKIKSKEIHEKVYLSINIPAFSFSN